MIYIVACHTSYVYNCVSQLGSLAGMHSLSEPHTSELNSKYTVVSQKECPWAEHLTSLPKGGMGILLSVLDLTAKELPLVRQIGAIYERIAHLMIKA